jgi:hypothetical protein
MMATTRGALSEDRYKAAQRATHLNPTIQLLSGNKAATQLPDGSWLNVANSHTRGTAVLGAGGVQKWVATLPLLHTTCTQQTPSPVLPYLQL